MGFHDRPPDNIEQLTARNISTDCPSCGDTVALIPWHHPSNTHDESYFVALCPNQRRSHCKPIFAIYQPLNDRIIDRYPIPSYKASSLHEAIPVNIREDFAEAKRCLSVRAYKASVAMCRRVVEALACDKLGKKAKGEDGKTMKLYKLIDTLHADGLITKNIKETAHELRHFGNYGAHLQDDGLDKVVHEEAMSVKEITQQLLHLIYIAPFETDQLRQARISKKQI